MVKTFRLWRSKVTPLGFEPTHPKIVELESTASDHSAKVSLKPDDSLRRVLPRSLVTHPATETPRFGTPGGENVRSHKGNLLPVGLEPTTYGS